MSIFTTQIKYLRSNNFDLGLSSYPIFDETYRNTLNNKILDHYNFREIGFETAGLFKFYLKTKMNEIMPYYNQLYKSSLLIFNPLYNMNLKETMERENTAVSSGNSESNSNSNSSGNSEQNGKNLIQDTPQGTLVNTDMASQDHASEMNYNKSDNTSQSESTIADTSTTTSNVNNLEDYTKIVEGNSGNKSNSEMLIDFRKTFLNIDMEIINELNGLFMGLWK